MNDELQNKLAEVLGGIAEGVTQAKDFAVEQLPDVAQQYIMFGMVWETAAFVLLVAFSVVCAFVFKFGLRWHKEINAKTGYHDDVGPFMVMLGSGLMFAFFVTGTVVQLKAVLLVWFAPKLYLLQGIAGLVK